MDGSFDTIVIGGGMAGVSVARELVKAGATTLLVDRGDEGRATDAGAGILSPETTRHDDEGWVALAMACGEHYRHLVPELEAEADDTGYARCGLLTLAVADWDLEAFEELAALAQRRRAERGGPGHDALREVEPATARDRFPALGAVTGALWNGDAARVDGRRMAGALRRSARYGGLVFREGGADRLVRAGGRVTAVEVGDDTFACGAVVIAGGAWSAVWADDLGVPVAVTPVRGQILHLRLEGIDTSGWPIIQPVLGHYLVPWPDGRVVVGATVETVGFDPRPTVTGMRQLLRDAVRIAPGLADATFVEVRVGLRPASDDGLPILGPVPGHDNVHLATGYGADGLLLGPYCGRLVAAAALGATPDIDLGPFSVARFAQTPEAPV